MDMPSSKIKVELEVPASQARLPGDVELNVFRIIQQACQNAIQHGSATLIYLSGLIDPDCVDISVEDNGCGFEIGEKLDLPSLLANHHFGLAGMLERADLIKAKIYISSAPGKGTLVHIVWKFSNPE
jgi:two-component system sensor histidine kinase DegS